MAREVCPVEVRRVASDEDDLDLMHLLDLLAEKMGGGDCGILGRTLQGILGLSEPPVLELEVPQDAPEDLELNELRDHSYTMATVVRGRRVQAKSVTVTHTGHAKSVTVTNCHSKQRLFTIKF